MLKEGWVEGREGQSEGGKEEGEGRESLVRKNQQEKLSQLEG